MDGLFNVRPCVYAVATASARGHESESTVAASALPKLREWPRVPDEVHTAKGVSRLAIKMPVVMFRGESPA